MYFWDLILALKPFLRQKAQFARYGWCTVWKKILRSSRLELFLKKCGLKNFVGFTEKYMRWNLFFNKVADIQPTTLSKKTFRYRCFLINFTIFKTIFFIEHLRLTWLIRHYKKQPLADMFDENVPGGLL